MNWVLQELPRELPDLVGPSRGEHESLSASWNLLQDVADLREHVNMLFINIQIDIEYCSRCSFSMIVK